MLGVAGSNLTIFKFEPITHNISQHVATRRNTSQHVATRWPNARNMLRLTMLQHVALACCDRLAGASVRPVSSLFLRGSYQHFRGVYNTDLFLN